MKYRVLGKTGLRVSVIGMGTWQLGGEWNKDFSSEEVARMFAAARACGINLIDTAECYGDHLSEALVGEAIAGGREDWILATKFGHAYHGFMNRSEPRGPADVEKQLEDSLKALRTDYIDIYQYHSWRNEEFKAQEIRAVLEKAVKEGKILHVGSSISPNTNIVQTDLSAEFRVDVIQVIYNRLDRAAEKEVIPSCQRQNLGVLARVPLASGYLTGKYKPGAEFPPQDVRAKLKPADLDARLVEVDRIAHNEVPAGVAMAQWALGWCLLHPALSCVIPGCKDVKQVESNAAAAELEMVRANHPLAVT